MNKCPGSTIVFYTGDGLCKSTTTKVTSPYEIHDTIRFHRAGPVKYEQCKISQGRPRGISPSLLIPRGKPPVSSTFLSCGNDTV